MDRPGNPRPTGEAHPSLHVLVEGARESVVCSTFNIQRSSALWVALAAAAMRPDVAVRLYLDTRAADKPPRLGSPTTAEVANEMAGATVLRTAGAARYVRNHAKFVSVDHRFLVVTSANVSKSAEQHNVEFGLRIDDVVLAQAIERQMRAARAPSLRGRQRA